LQARGAHSPRAFCLQEEKKMRTFSVGMMAITFVLGVGIISLLFVVGKMVMDMAQNAYRKQYEELLVLAEN
jgi:hypothetical protein